ncbi:MAG: fatty acid CoA ligase family protein [Planctomycetota bacterium]
MTDAVNISSALAEQAAARPDAVALVHVDGSRVSYGELEADVRRIAAGLEAVGAGRGVRAALLVPPGPDFFPLVFGMFRAGTIPVVVDPGMGLATAKDCLAEAAPEAFIGIPKAHLARKTTGLGGKAVKVSITVGAAFAFGGLTLKKVRKKGEGGSEAAPTAAADDAAILYTSGSTGAPKGAVYTHGNFAAQVERVRACTGIEPGEVDLPTFPLFALFDPALGMTTVVPDMDPSRPAEAKPAALVRQVRDHGVTTMFGSPAVLENLVGHLESNGESLEGLKRVITAGAPVPPRLVDRARAVLADPACILTPYGATEALPVSCGSGDEDFAALAARTEGGEGVWIGKPVEGAEVRRIRVTDDPVEAWTDELVAADDEVGEIVVKGPQVTRRYVERPEADATAKITDGDDVWHRMGDLARVDADGHLWSVGRKSQRVRTAKGDLHTLQVERAADGIDGVYRSALVGVGEPGEQASVLVVDQGMGRDLQNGRPRIEKALREHAATAAVEHVLWYGARLPVDTRHNAKLRREELAAWAAQQLKT